MKNRLFNCGFRYSLLAALLAVAFLPASLQAQLTRGAISGTVRDAAGAVIADANVKITNLDTNLTRATTTNGAGLYRVTALEPGPYSVVIGKKGFAGVENQAIIVRTSQEVTFNTDLDVATTTNVVDVSAQAEGVTLNKSNPTIGLTSTARQSVDLPLSAGRDVNQLALLSPNVFTAPGSTGISANGQRARNNNFTIDGSDNNDISVTLSTTPIIPEAVAEFQVQTNAYNAEFGRNSGAQINVITRSGSNQFHGDAFEYYRGSALNALDNIEKGAGRTEPARFNRNQFGFDLGGPIVKDRTFIFGALQGDRLRSGGELGPRVRIPTPAGFAALGGVPLRAGQSQASRQAVLGAIGFLNDVYALNPAFNNILDTPVNGVAIQTANVAIPISQPNNTWNFIVRGDHQIREGDNLTVRYTYDKPVDTNAVSNIQFGPRFAGNQNILDQNAAISETHVFSPNILNEFRFSFVRRDLQFPENDPNSPTATIAGNFFTIGGLANFPQGRVQNSFQFSDIVSAQAGRHALKFGADIRRTRLFNLSAFNSKGSFTFNNLQDYLNNTAVTFTQALQTSSFDARQTQQFYFVQDDFRVTPSLTLNLGLRYEYSGVPFGFFGATDQQSLGALVPGPVNGDRNNFAPRIGFSYSPRAEGGFFGKLLGDGQTVFRGGYGISYDLLFYNILTVNASNFPRVVTGLQDNATDVFPNLAPVSGAPVFNPLATFVNTPERARTPYAQLYSFSIQREFQRDFVVEAGYTGSRGINQINQLQANPATLTAAQAATVRATGAANSIPTVQQRRFLPQFGSRVLIATEAQSTYNAGFVSVNKRLARGLQFGAAYTYSKNISDNDESLGVGAITAGSPQIPQDFLNRRAERGVSAFDRTHRFVINYLYEVPWFKSGWAQLPVVKQVFSGWQVSGVTAAQAGQPFTILTGVDSNGNGAGGDRPNFNPGGAFTPDPITGNLRTFTASRTDGRFLVPLGANGLPLQNGLGNGNLGRNTLRGPGFSDWDISVSKRFTLHEAHKLVFRADFFNAFNQDSYGNPVNNLNSPDFGRNLNNFGNRSITLGAKYSF
ncbi:MAG: TonB-dependent receptor domain-containing protein [Blastocatellia bacterium]